MEPHYIILIGAAILGLLAILFFESRKRRRLIGTLAIVVALATVLTTVFHGEIAEQFRRWHFQSRGGVAIHFQLKPKFDPVTLKTQPVTETDREEMIDIVLGRLERLGVEKISLVLKSDQDAFVIQIPEKRLADIEKDLLLATKSTTFEARMVQSNTGNVALDHEVDPGWIVVPYAEGKTDFEGNPLGETGLIVSRRVTLSIDHIQEAFWYQDPNYGNTISLRFNPQGSQIWATTTNNNIGERFAMILNGKILIAPSINTPILGGSSIIYGNFSPEEAQEYATALQAPLPSLVTVEKAEEIPPK